MIFSFFPPIHKHLGFSFWKLLPGSWWRAQDMLCLPVVAPFSPGVHGQVRFFEHPEEVGEIQTNISI